MNAILAAGPWRNNAEMIADCARLGYLHEDWITLDPTYGLGRFWTVWRPRTLYASDLDVSKSPCGYPVDFTRTLYPDRSIDAVVFDPPYKLNGTSTGTGGATCDEDYGVASYCRWQDRHQLIRDGITECARVLRFGGYLLVKCQDQVSSGQVRWQTREFSTHAETLGCRLVDMLHLSSYRG